MLDLYRIHLQKIQGRLLLRRPNPQRSFSNEYSMSTITFHRFKTSFYTINHSKYISSYSSSNMFTTSVCVEIFLQKRKTKTPQARAHIVLQSFTRYHWKAHLHLYLFVFVARWSNPDVFHYQPIKTMSPATAHEGALPVRGFPIPGPMWAHCPLISQNCYFRSIFKCDCDCFQWERERQFQPFLLLLFCFWDNPIHLKSQRIIISPEFMDLC